MNLPVFNLWIVTVFFLCLVEISVGKKCYACFYWNAPEVPGNIRQLNDASCGKGNTPEKRFQQECKQGEICAEAHVEFLKEKTDIKSISSRSCVKPDKVINQKCVPLKTFEDLSSLEKTSQIVTFTENAPVKDGVICGCTGDLCNSASKLFISNCMVVIIVLHLFWAM